MIKLFLTLVFVFLPFVCFGGGLSDFFGSTCTWYNSTFTSNGNFTVPSGVTEVYVDMCASGGGGAGFSDASGAGGGQGGGFCYDFKVSVVPGEIISVTIGSGGAGGAIGESGEQGGNSTFGDYITTVGGLGGTCGDGGGVFGGDAGETGVGEKGGDAYVSSGSLVANTLIVFGACGGGGTGAELSGGDGGATFPFGYLGGSGATGSGSGGGGGGAGLFGPGGDCNGSPPSANSGAGGGGVTAQEGKAGASGKCVIRWCK